MLPETIRICLTVSEATKHWCITVPTFAAVWKAAERFIHDVVLKHPYITAAILLLWALYPLAPFQILWFFVWVIPHSIIVGINSCLGFERHGIRSDSIASRYQSRRYGAYTPANSVFSGAQSYGAINHDGSARANGAGPHPLATFLCRVMQVMLVYVVILLLLQGGSHH